MDPVIETTFEMARLFIGQGNDMMHTLFLVEDGGIIGFVVCRHFGDDADNLLAEMELAALVAKMQPDFVVWQIDTWLRTLSASEYPPTHDLAEDPESVECIMQIKFAPDAPVEAWTMNYGRNDDGSRWFAEPEPVEEGIEVAGVEVLAQSFKMPPPPFTLMELCSFLSGREHQIALLMDQP